MHEGRCSSSMNIDLQAEVLEPLSDIHLGQNNLVPHGSKAGSIDVQANWIHNLLNRNAQVNSG